MREVRNSAKAERDLINIWRYGYEEWGETEADRYVYRIEDALLQLRLQPGIGVDCSDMIPGLWRWRAGEHHIYYEFDADRIYVVRILGSRQDARARLRE
ncbi:MAG TPA: type II toxin-antitoxin system RelE/ParE family toxin [Allosphingosinicella sp.]|jgi:toxin ParE1/3/4